MGPPFMRVCGSARGTLAPRLSVRETLTFLAYAHGVIVEPDQSERLAGTQFPSPEAKGLFFERAISAGEVTQGDVVLVSGRVVETAADPDDLERLRLVIVPALTGSPQDTRHMVVVVPRDRVMALARSHDIEQAPPAS
jgi:hypothetical protein